MQWQQTESGLLRRFTLEDGTIVVGLLKQMGEQEELIFYTDSDDPQRLERDGEKLGGLAELIDELGPEDIIEICCKMKAAPNVDHTEEGSNE